jgi:hypothetical protein
MREVARSLRCAIYTRKSSEEGLEQDFNSLHAQREACEAVRAHESAPFEIRRILSATCGPRRRRD